MEIPYTSLSACFILVFCASSSGATGVFSWDPPSAPVPDSGGAGHVLFRSILEDPEFDSEPFWERDQRWSETLKKSHSGSQPIPLAQSGDFVPDIRLTDWMNIPELSLALAPLSLGGGLLLLRRKLNLSPATG